jgi:predicted PurR-regulated permease PerM
MPIPKSTAHFLFILFVLVITACFFILIKDFLIACFWATVLAVVFDPTYQIIKEKLPERQTLALILTMLLIIVIFVVPLTSITLLILQESADYYGKIESGEIDPHLFIQKMVDLLPKANDVTSLLGIKVKSLSFSIGDTFAQAVKYLAQQLPLYTQNLLNLVAQIALMFYVLFFLLRDGPQIIRKLIHTLPLGDNIEKELFERFTSVARATVKGGLIVALIQGSIGGFTFLLLGIPAAFFWGALMILLSLLPIGSALLWVPVALILFLQGHIVKSMILVGVGFLIIGLIDNFLRPRLVGKDVKMPDYIVLVSTLGGLAWFSLSGFVLGPLIAAVFISCWELLAKSNSSTGV